MAFDYSALLTEAGNAGLIHVLALLLSLALCAYGLVGFIRYYKGSSKNEHLLFASFIMFGLMCVTDLLGYFELLPGKEIGHHLSIFAGIISFYFLYRFAALMQSTEPEKLSKIAIPVLVAVVLAFAFSLLEQLYEVSFAPIITIAYTLLLLVMAFFVYLLVRIVYQASKLDTSFSLKSFSISMIPIISVSLFVLLADIILLEVSLDVLKLAENAPIPLLLGALQNLLYIVTAMTVTGFGYMSEKIYNFYAPLRKFFESKKKKA